MGGWVEWYIEMLLNVVKLNASEKCKCMMRLISFSAVNMYNETDKLQKRKETPHSNF